MAVVLFQNGASVGNMSRRKRTSQIIGQSTYLKLSIDKTFSYLNKYTSVVMKMVTKQISLVQYLLLNKMLKLRYN